MLDHLQRPGRGIADDHCQAGRHRLQQGIRHPLKAGGQHEHRRSQQKRQGIALKACELHPLRQASRRRLALQGRALAPIPNQHQRPGCRRAGAAGQGLQQQIQPLLMHQPADADEARGPGRGRGSLGRQGQSRQGVGQQLQTLEPGHGLQAVQHPLGVGGHHISAPIEQALQPGPRRRQALPGQIIALRHHQVGGLIPERQAAEHACAAEQGQHPPGLPSPGTATRLSQGQVSHSMVRASTRCRRRRWAERKRRARAHQLRFQ